MNEKLWTVDDAVRNALDSGCSLAELRATVAASISGRNIPAEPEVKPSEKLDVVALEQAAKAGEIVDNGQVLALIELARGLFRQATGERSRLTWGQLDVLDAAFLVNEEGVEAVGYAVGEPDPDTYYAAQERVTLQRYDDQQAEREEKAWYDENGDEATEQRLDDQQAEDDERGDEWNSPRYETPRPRK